jgi:ABC-type dipeptide/oligopeptide/nickel transport system permease component
VHDRRADFHFEILQNRQEIVVGIPLGYFAAKRAGGVLDTLTVSGSLLGVVVPVFVLAYLLKVVFAVGLPGSIGPFRLSDLAVLPSSGRQTVTLDATHYTNFYVLDGIMTRLDPATFVRVHRSAIVNIEMVKELEQEGERKYIAILSDAAGTRVPIARDRLDEVKTRLGV